VSAADLCLALALSALLSVVVAAAQYMRAEKAEAEVERLTDLCDEFRKREESQDCIRERLTAEVERLERWKFEATEVMSGLRELGKALGLGLGVQITGPAALVEVERLTAERDALAAQVARVESLAGQWERLAVTAINPNSREWLQACAATLRECLSGWQKMHAALAGSRGRHERRGRVQRRRRLHVRAPRSRLLRGHGGAVHRPR
jgi:uncharacterized protein (UPF0335 family)